ncbi:hypothetical protein ZIOFF_020062 [Zingiber officinale]|uniref:RecA family profile 1 domain-containing protein n=1 Tax=Zingiber officinale TaxID=94328 RepID=A0A8J5HYQ5_ZINOF|nr:hypothetical protein ZIOFF_020062 [Zingiber officinale]
MNPRGINDEAEDPRAWIHGDESAKTMLARLLIERSLLLLPPLHRLPLRVGNVVEITGPSSSAKSQVLLQAAVHCILPKEWKGIRFGGLERIVIYFDLDCRFDVRRLTQILKFRILGVLGSINGSNRAHQEGFQEYHGEASIMNSVYDELIVACMKRFLYIRCYDSYEFLAALKASPLLQRLICIAYCSLTMHSRAQVESGVLGVGIHFLLIDRLRDLDGDHNGYYELGDTIQIEFRIGAFYWIDRSIQPSNSLDYKSFLLFGSKLYLFSRGTMSFQHLVETIVQEIRKFLEVQPVLVLVSKASIFGAGTSIDAQRDIEMCTSSRDTDKVLYREYMPSAWQAFVTHRINLQLSDKYTNDKKGGTSPIYTSEWVQPPLNIKDQFAVADVKFLYGKLAFWCKRDLNRAYTYPFPGFYTHARESFKCFNLWCNDPLTVKPDISQPQAVLYSQRCLPPPQSFL